MDQKQRFQISKALMGNQNAKKRKTVNSVTPVADAETSSTGAPVIAEDLDLYEEAWD